MTYHDAVREASRAIIRRALDRADGNRTHAARELGLQRTYLQRLIRVLDVEAPRPDAPRSAP